MDNRNLDHSILREWLYLEHDGALTTGQRSRLQQHLNSCGECQKERLEVQALDRLLEKSKIPVSAEFASEVMSGLPAAAWEARVPRNLVAALVAVVALVIGSTLLIGLSSDQLIAAAPLAAIAAVAEMFRASALAGAGMLAASWKGLGIAIQDALGGSIWNLLGFGALVLCLNVLLFRLLSRRSLSRVVADDSDSSESR